MPHSRGEAAEARFKPADFLAQSDLAKAGAGAFW
jgi:hypothetical protein